MERTYHKKKIIDKIRQHKGESLIETLVSVLIMSLGFTMLAGAIVSSAKVNATAKKMTTMAKETVTKDDENNWNVEKSLSGDVGDITISISYNGNSATVNKDIYRYGEAGKGVYVFK